MPDNPSTQHLTAQQLEQLAEQIKDWGTSLGFQQVAIVEPDLQKASERLKQWLADGFQGSMQWMGEHGDKRYRVDQLVDQTVRVISVRMDYLADNNMIAVLKDDNKAYISRYALGRDYHKLIRKRLAQLVTRIQEQLPELQLAQRPFVDSAPVMKNPLPSRRGWAGLAKIPYSLTIRRDPGSSLVKYTHPCHYPQTKVNRSTVAVTAGPV